MNAKHGVDYSTRTGFLIAVNKVSREVSRTNDGLPRRASTNLEIDSAYTSQSESETKCSKFENDKGRRSRKAGVSWEKVTFTLDFPGS